MEIKKTRQHNGYIFEERINKSCEYFRKQNLAIIYKKPTPIQVVKVMYPIRSKAKITEAYYRIPSTTDYNGIYKGRYIDFEAKSCSSTSFSFEAIFSHQIEHLKQINNHYGIAFLIIEFTKYNKTFILDIEKLLIIYDESLIGGRKSIPYNYFVSEGIEVEKNINGNLNILDAIDKLYKI